MLGLIGLIIANQSSSQWKITMQESISVREGILLGGGGRNVP